MESVSLKSRLLGMLLLIVGSICLCIYMIFMQQVTGHKDLLPELEGLFVPFGVMMIANKQWSLLGVLFLLAGIGLGVYPIITNPESISFLPMVGVSLLGQILLVLSVFCFFTEKQKRGIGALLLGGILLCGSMYYVRAAIFGGSELIISYALMIMLGFGAKLPKSNEKNIAFEEQTKVKSKNGNEMELKRLWQEAERKEKGEYNTQEDTLCALLAKHYIFLEFKSHEAIQEARNIANEIARVDQFTSLLLLGDMHYQSAREIARINGDPSDDAKRALGFYQQAEVKKRVCAWLWAKYAGLFMLSRTPSAWNIVEKTMKNARDINSEDLEVKAVAREYEWKKKNQHVLKDSVPWDADLIHQYNRPQGQIKKQ